MKGEGKRERGKRREVMGKEVKREKGGGRKRRSQLRQNGE